MVETKITRKEVFVTESSELNKYGDLIVTDKAGKTHKIGKKRPNLFDVFQPDRAVEVGYGEYMNREYIAVAHPVAEGLAPPIPAETSKPVEGQPVPSGEKTPMSKDHSIARLNSINNAALWVSNGMIGMENFTAVAAQIERYTMGELNAGQLQANINALLKAH
uniref:Uncharacterized protein n=1 Tax=viral metagenome TaxID=1070528 RepID=A0A6M3IIK8_9ZZZZ